MTSISSQTPVNTTAQQSVATLEDSLQGDSTSNTQRAHGLPNDLVHRLLARLETGVDDIDSHRLNEISAEHYSEDRTRQVVIVKARVYSHTQTAEEEYEEMMFAHFSKDIPIFLEKLKRMMQDRKEGDCIWVRLYGMDDGVVEGITKLCGFALTYTELFSLPKFELLQHFLLSQPKRPCPHLEIHPSHTVIQYQVYGTSSGIREVVIEACYVPKKRPIELPENPKASRLLLKHREVNDMLKLGLISTFIIPSVNLVLTVTPQRYVCPATRMAEYAARMMNHGLDMCLATNADLLGLSLLHRAVGYAAGTVLDFTRLIQEWEDEARRSASTTRTAEIHQLLLHLHTFRARIRELQPIHEQLIGHHKAQTNHENIEVSIVSAQAVMLLEQSETGRRKVLEDLQDVLNRGEILEVFCFNMLSSRANDSMERLAIVTIVFLPLTFIASYFSMGFQDFTVLNQSPSFFWKISVPLAFAFFLIFAYSTLRRLVKYTYSLLERGYKTTRATESFKRLKDQWWDKPINRRRQERMMQKFREINRTFQRQDLPPPSYMPRERLRPYNPNTARSNAPSPFSDDPRPPSRRLPAVYTPPPPPSGPRPFSPESHADVVARYRSRQ